MHIPDGYLGPETYGSLWAAMVPIWLYAARKVRRAFSASRIPFLAMASAFSFMVMIFTIPLPGGTTAHVTGGTLVAILLGPWAAVISVSIALFIQALLFGDGGITAISANCFNIAFVGPVTGYGLYLLVVKVGKGLTGSGASAVGDETAPVTLQLLGAAVGAYGGINAAALFTALELGIQPILHAGGPQGSTYFPYPLSVSIPAVMITHFTVVGVLEAGVAVLVLLFLRKTQPQMIDRQKAVKAIFLALFLLFQASEVTAHEFWIEQKGKDLMLVYGHGTSREEFDFSKVKEVQAFDAQGKQVALKKEKRDKGLLLRSSEHTALVTIEIDNGYWSKTIYGWKELPKQKASRVVTANRSFSYAKTLLSWGDFVTKPTGETKLDIIPIRNPFELNAGESLPIKVLYQGKPLAGAGVEGSDHNTVGTTDKEGTATVPLSKGHNVIKVEHKTPIQGDPDADFLDLTVTLTFEVKQ